MVGVVWVWGLLDYFRWLFLFFKICVMFVFDFVLLFCFVLVCILYLGNIGSVVWVICIMGFIWLSLVVLYCFLDVEVLVLVVGVDDVLGVVLVYDDLVGVLVGSIFVFGFFVCWCGVNLFELSL